MALNISLRKKISSYLKITSLLAANLLGVFLLTQFNYFQSDKIAEVERAFYSSNNVFPSIPSVLGQSTEITLEDKNHFEELSMEHIMRLKDGDLQFKEICLEANNKLVSRAGCEENEKKFLERQLDEEKKTTQAQAIKITSKPKAIIKPKPKHPMPYIFDTVNGRRVCNKKNDKPAKSTRNKKKHLDMECCLDPDEIPNSNCYYNPQKYGKFL